MNLAEQKTRPLTERHSPCVGICRLDPRTGLCLGCVRSGEEIAQWSSLDEQGRDAIWDALPERAAMLSISARLLPRTAGEILTWAAHTIENRLGTWVTGMPGAVAEFVSTKDQHVTVNLENGAVIADTGTALFRLRRHEKLRAFAFGQSGSIVLALPKARLTRATADVFTVLGKDQEAIQSPNRDDVLFDYGLGAKSSRFCIRTGDTELISLLEPLNGKPWPEIMAAAGAKIIAESPHRVVESELARIEVFAPIPPPGGQSPAGAHTHFLPRLLAAGDDIPASLALPEYASPTAIFYPA
jgi:predicted Fe-S protein YdhL (DUF1289 family)